MAEFDLIIIIITEKYAIENGNKKVNGNEDGGGGNDTKRNGKGLYLDQFCAVNGRWQIDSLFANIDDNLKPVEFSSFVSLNSNKINLKRF